MTNLGMVWRPGSRSPDEWLRERFAQLSPSVQREVVKRAVEWGVQTGFSEWVSMGGPSMGAFGQDALTQLTQVAVERALAPIVPMLGAKLLEIVRPAAEKAAEIVGPAVRKEIEAKIPVVAISTGIVAGILAAIGMVLVGGYVVRKVRR